MKIDMRFPLGRERAFFYRSWPHKVVLKYSKAVPWPSRMTPFAEPSLRYMYLKVGRYLICS